MMNPLWLNTLLKVYETGSFTRAADQLDLTQAAVSQHIQRLEEEFGRLLLRKTRPLELTPQGAIMLDFARQQQVAYARLRARLSDDDPCRGPVNLITQGSIGLLLYPLLLEQQQLYPELTVHHRFAPTPDIIQSVLEGRSDVGLLDQPAAHPRLVVEPFARDRLCLVVPRTDEKIGWEALCKLGFIDHPDGRNMALRLLGRRYPGRRFDEIKISGLTNQIGFILEPVARGLGFTVLPRFAVTAYAQQDKISVIAGPVEVIDTIWIAYRTEWPLPARYKRLIELLKKEITGHGDE